MMQNGLQKGDLSNEAIGTFVYLAGSEQQTVVEISGSTRKVVHGIWLDLINMTSDGTIQLHYKVDGTNYRTVNINSQTQSYEFLSTDAADGIFIEYNFGIKNDFKVTYTSAGSEGSNRDIPYSVVYSTLE